MTIDQIPPGRKLSPEVVQAHVEDTKRAKEMGRIGYWLGSQENASTYISGLLALFFAIILSLIIFLPITGIEKRDALQILGGFFLAALGYAMGSINRGDR